LFRTNDCAKRLCWTNRKFGWSKATIMRKPLLALLLATAVVQGAGLPAVAQTRTFPSILDIRERVKVVNAITLKRLDTILPRVMEETEFDMWIIVCNEDNLDPVFNTMIPYDVWCPITQILVLSKKPGRAVERLNISRTDMKGLHQNAWDHRAWDTSKTESQWDCLRRVVEERNPQRIAVNQSPVIWAADGLTVTLRNRLEETLGPELSGRLHSGERLAILWLETLLEEELDIYERVATVAHALLAEIFSGQTITPGVTTVDDLLYSYIQKVSDSGLELFAWPWIRIRGRSPEDLEKYGPDDQVIRRGDLVQCDAGIKYLRYYSDHCEWAYILRPGERDVPEGIRKVMAEANRLQDIFCAAFREGLSGNRILADILDTARQKGICKPKIYSHSIGRFLHEPGPLIGLPWEQKDTGARGEVRLVPNSTFTAELSVTCPVPEWNGRELTLALEQLVAFTGKDAYFMDGRQTSFYIVK
jgi:hypothetical protein